MWEYRKLCDDIDCRVFSSEDKKSEYPLYVTDNIKKKTWRLKVKIAKRNFEEYTMRTNLPKFLDLLIVCIYSLNFSFKSFIMFFCNKSTKY